MNKAEFLQSLSALLGALSESERTRVLDYYAEMIDDRVEAGMSEVEAVAAMGAPEAVLRELSLEPVKPRSDATALVTTDILREVRLRVRNADVRLCRGPMPAGVAAQLSGERCEVFQWRLEGGVLEIVEPPTKQRFSLLFNREPALTVTLWPAPPEALELHSDGGDLELDGLEVLGQVRAVTSSGDVTLKNLACGGEVSVQSSSGDLKAQGVQASALSLESNSGDLELRKSRADGIRARTTSGDAKLSDLEARSISLTTQSGDAEAGKLNAFESLEIGASSGDLTLSRVRAGDASVHTASGDMEITELGARSLTLNASSGDIEADGLTLTGTLQVGTTSGDTTLSRVRAGGIDVRTSSGDVELQLVRRAEGYALRTQTASGAVSADNLPPMPSPDAVPVAIRTASGDIDVMMA